MTEPKTPIWRNRNFLIVWLGQSISMMGSSLSYIALYWWVVDTTESAGALASVALIAIAPTLLLGPIAGVFVDRFDRRRVMAAMNVINVGIYGTVASLMHLGVLEVWHLYVFMPLGAVATLIHKAALRSSIPNLVPPQALQRANSLYQISRSICSIVGVLAGGILVGLIGGGATMWLDASTFVIAAVALLFVSFSSPRGAETGGWQLLLRETGDGFRFLFREPLLLTLVFLFALVNFLLAPINVSFPLMAHNVLGTGSEGLSMLYAALSVGTLVGGLVTSLVKRFKRRGLWIVAGFVLVGGTLALFGASQRLHLSIAALVATGVGVAWVNIFEAVVFQSRVPNELQGRVFSAQLALGDSLQPVSLAAAGSILMVVPAPTVVVGSGIIIVVAGLLGLLSREIRTL